MKIKHPLKICGNIGFWCDTNEATQRKHPHDRQCKCLWLLQGLKCKKKKKNGIGCNNQAFSLCTDGSGFFQFFFSEFKSNALINTNAPFHRRLALSWAINQLTDGLPHRPCRKHLGLLLRPYLVLEPDQDAVERFLINTTLLVVPLFCGSLVNYGGYPVCAAALKVEAGFWNGTALSSQTQAAACLDVDISVCRAMQQDGMHHYQ